VLSAPQRRRASAVTCPSSPRCTSPSRYRSRRWPARHRQIPARANPRRAAAAARSPCTPRRRPWQQVWGTPGLLDPSVSLTAYRLVQEALTNTVKHAGPGTAARVGLAWAPEQLAITVQKEAPVSGRKSHAAAALSTGYGLVGLRERVQTVGGTLHAGPTGTGFVVQAALPVAAPPSTSPYMHSEPEKVVH
jgi:hypothetical protein